MLLLFIFMFTAISISFICSIMEAVLLSITPSYIARLKKSKPAAASLMQDLKEKVDQPLAAILTLNTIAHTAGAAGVGAQAASIYGDSAIGIASAVMTLLVLVFSEIIPKTLGANYWRRLGPIVCRGLVWLIWVLKPFIWLSDQITKLFATKQDDSAHIRDEIEAMAEIGSEAGALREDEAAIISSLLRFRHTTLNQVLTPRTVLFKLHKDVTVGEYVDTHGSVSFSRVLVFNDDGDDIIGYVLKSDVMLAFHRLGADYRIAKLVKPIHTVPETIQLPNLFTTLLEKRLHICLVVDEYGDVQGIVTLEDMIESLLGVNILDERDQSKDLREKALSQWQKHFDERDHLIDGSKDDETKDNENKESKNKDSKSKGSKNI